MIEYVNATFNPFTGCLHGKDICATSATCWARAMSKRFTQVCGGDFAPRWHPDRLSQPFSWKKPRRVATCFMGDLFGAWNNVDSWPDVRSILDVVAECDRHQFLFLTKRPENLAQFNPWPANAWVGCSITGAETPERQAAMLDALHQVEGAGVRWLSYEPALGPLAQPVPSWISWLVIGAQSGKGAKVPAPGDIWIIRGTGKERPSIWEKNSLSKVWNHRYLKRPLIQELPR